MLTDLFDSPQSKPAQKLAQLGARRRELLAQERDALSSLETAQAEHARLQQVIADDEARALALGNKPAIPKDARGKLPKLSRQIDEHTNASDRLARAIVAIDDEARRVTMNDCDELVAEAIASHDAARARITDLVSELNYQQAGLRSAYVACQSVLAAAGKNALTLGMSDPPSIESLVREGGAPPLMHEDDRALVA